LPAASASWLAAAHAPPPPTHQVLELLFERWMQGAGLESALKLGLVVSTLFLRPALLAQFRPELSQLIQYATEDDDQWVRLMAHAGARLEGQCVLDPVLVEVPKVRPDVRPLSLSCHSHLVLQVGETMDALRTRLRDGSTFHARDFRPLEVTPAPSHVVCPRSEPSGAARHGHRRAG
jgi:hypothetical protein